MHHHPRNRERAINLSILAVSGAGEFPVLTQIEPQNPSLSSIPLSFTTIRRVVSQTAPDSWQAKFTVRTTAVSDRLRTSDFHDL
ncbi:hypothetical protein NPIL_120641 [Nephila pilipes]|uniref:Uncharacterized protein n=1 Tax=Nephila pilipes TaxID=299642 RepID=A0A8X6MP80_NEPPI|nr:hypothetical protein NPIL_120641 [Nephila pilipes]